MTIPSYHPRTGVVTGAVAESSPEDVTAAVTRALAVTGLVEAAGPAARRGWLYAVADALEADLTSLVALADSETGLGEARLTGEVRRTAGQLRFYGDVAAEGSYLGVTVDRPTATTPELVRVNRPLGPVAVFGASNFPFAFSVLGNDTASAIAAGCPVVVKAHPAHPLLSERLAALATRALAAAGAPDGTFGCVAGMAAGAALVTAEAISAVAFTGSQSGGMALWELANRRPVVIPVFAEMGTVNPVVVTRAAARDIAALAVGFVASFTLGSGQFCTKPGLLFAPTGCAAADAVGKALIQAAPKPVMLTEGIARSVAGGLAELREAGAEVVAQVPPSGDGWSAPAVVLRAPVDALRPGSRLLQECFGAVAVVVEYADDAQLADALHQLQGSLAGSVFTAADGPDADAPRILGLLAGTVGRVAVNDWPTGVAFTWAQQHGGPWPSTSRPDATSVGAAALARFVRPVTYQSTRDEWLPLAARASNPWRIPRRVDGVLRLPLDPTGERSS